MTFLALLALPWKPLSPWLEVGGEEDEESQDGDTWETTDSSPAAHQAGRALKTLPLEGQPFTWDPRSLSPWISPLATLE